MRTGYDVIATGNTQSNTRPAAFRHKSSWALTYNTAAVLASDLFAFKNLSSTTPVGGVFRLGDVVLATGASLGGPAGVFKTNKLGTAWTFARRTEVETGPGTYSSVDVRLQAAGGYFFLVRAGVVGERTASASGFPEKGKFIAVSEDGDNWSTASHPDPFAGNIDDIDRVLHVASDGVTFVATISRNSPAAASVFVGSAFSFSMVEGVPIAARFVVYDETNEVFIATPFGASSTPVSGMRSADGSTWETITLPYASATIPPVYGNGKVILPSPVAGSSISTDGGTTWTSGGSVGTGEQISFVDGYFFAISGSQIIRSRDGVNWRSFPMPAISGQTLSSIVGVG